MLEKKNMKLHTSLKLLGDELRKERNLDRLDYLSQVAGSIVAREPSRGELTLLNQQRTLTLLNQQIQPPYLNQ
jgi:hypothetical protein